MDIIMDINEHPPLISMCHIYIYIYESCPSLELDDILYDFLVGGL